MKILGIDIGGSAFKGAPVDISTGRLLDERHRVEISSPCSRAEGLAAVRSIVKHFNWRGPVGIGFPGIIVDGHIGAVGNLGKTWENLNGRTFFKRACPGQVSVVNDADAAGLAEMRFGAGRKKNGPVLLLTLGTGIGSALFFNGELFPNSEFGHIPWRGRPFERFASSSARKRARLDWKAWTDRLNIYLSVVERISSPSLIILGGGISKKSDQWLHLVRTKAKVVPARMGNEAGIVGAALAALPAKK